MLASLAIIPLTTISAILPAAAAEPAYLTIVMGRSNWVATEGCTPMPDTIDLGQVAEELHGRGLTATGLVVTTTALETGRFCQSNIGTHANWADLAMLRDDYGWTFDSTGAQHRNMLTLTPQQQLQESCGSLTALRNHGHDRSGALFGYPNNNYNATIQADVVSTCFDFGRRYSLAGDPVVTTRASAETDGGLQWTMTVNGNLPARYTPREQIAQLMNPAPGEWAVVQAYRFVTGARSGPASTWDCTSANPAEHWTSRAELYCWDDFRWALDRIGTDVVVTDPRTVADAWAGSPEPDPAYLTLAVGRSQWVSTEGCTPMPNTIDLGQVAEELRGRGLSATGLVVTTPTQESTRYCQSNIGIHASWSDLATLRDDYGWTFDSTGAQHRNMLTLTPEQQLQESCGSLTPLRNHGHDRSGALFGYPNNNYDATMQANVVSTCFDFGRRYSGDLSVTTRESAEAEGGLQWTLSVNGNMPARYTPREQIAQLMNPGPGEWTVVQVYRFVTGARSGLASTWDCTSANPAEHWTSRAELYCWDDFRWALDQIGSDVIVTDPRTVADAWFGVTEPPDTQAPTPTVTTPASGATVPLPVQIGGSVTDNVGVTQVEVAIRNNATMQWWTGSGWGGFRYNAATVASPGSASTTFSYLFNPPAGASFGYQVRAGDAGGNVSAPTAWRTFFGQASTPDTQAPSSTVTSPASGATVSLPVQIAGSVTDNVGVTQVEVAIRNNATMQWWTGSGWGAFRYNVATVTSPGSPSTTWSYQFAPPAGGFYGYQVRARDAAGNTSPPTAWRTFTAS